MPLLKNEIHIHEMQAEPDSPKENSHPKKISKSAQFIMYSIGKGGHLEKTLVLTLSS